MRTIFIGASPLAVMAARELLEDGHEVVIVEKDAERIERLSEELDCSFIHGDGARPALLKELSPENTDFLFYLSNNDRDNILGSLVARTLDFHNIFTKIEDLEFENICQTLGLSNLTIPHREVALKLVDDVNGHHQEDLSRLFECGLRFLSFFLGDDAPGSVGELDLPGETRVVAVLRGNGARACHQESELEKGDQVFVLTTEKHMDTLVKRFKRDAERAGEQAGG